jgi:endonuclease/exonuclease/phosphatase family metal-dependent hydrolase
MNWRWKLLAYTTIVFNLLLIFSYLSYLADPINSIWLSFLGLVYPVIFLTNIILFLIWFFKKKLFFLTTLICLIGGMYHHSRFIQLNPKISHDKSFKSKLKVMSFNVRLFDLYNWSKNEETKSEIISFIKDENPDIVCFQEYYYDSHNDFVTRDLILKELGLKFYHESFTNETNKNAHFGLATFSRYPIIEKDNFSFKNDHSNHCIWSDIVFEQDTLRIFNTHLGSIRFNNSDYNIIGGKGSPLWPHQKIPKQDIINRLKIGFIKRSQQLKELLPILNESTYNKIICCDLNDTPVSYAYNQFNGLYNDSFTISGLGVGGTYIGKIPFLRIDYIWHDKNLKSMNFKTYPFEYSDHRAISVDILF